MKKITTLGDGRIIYRCNILKKLEDWTWTAYIGMGWREDPRTNYKSRIYAESYDALISKIDILHDTNESI